MLQGSLWRRFAEGFPKSLRQSQQLRSGFIHARAEQIQQPILVVNVSDVRRVVFDLLGKGSAHQIRIRTARLANQ
jgi:hypothetical protein